MVSLTLMTCGMTLVTCEYSIQKIYTHCCAFTERLKGCRKSVKINTVCVISAKIPATCFYKSHVADDMKTQNFEAIGKFLKISRYPGLQSAGKRKHGN